VDRLAAGVHHALEIALIGANQHAARKQVARIETANRLQIHKTVLADMADQKADFIHMAQQHDARRVFFLGVAAAEQ